MSLTSHHTNAVVEEGLPKDHHVERLVHMRLLKHSQHSRGVHSRDQAAEQQVLKEVDVTEAKGLDLADEVEGEANAKGIDQGPQACPPQDGADVLKEGPGGHEVAALQDDGWKEVQEVDARIHDWRRPVVGAEDDGAHQKAHCDEDAAFWHAARQPAVQMEACGWPRASVRRLQTKQSAH